jgi:hypothetical protein
MTRPTSGQKNRPIKVQAELPTCFHAIFLATRSPKRLLTLKEDEIFLTLLNPVHIIFFCPVPLTQF